MKKLSRKERIRYERREQRRTHLRRTLGRHGWRFPENNQDRFDRR